ncbi:MAG TPA: beta-propeller fold lactonase family protein [Xanthomonadaceae bacterium]|nr:beta-propeller fold lactonase family protein [Xanthomonadaceae bacterium]
MKSLLVKTLGALLVGLLPWTAEARIEAPDHVIYGSVTIFGTPAAMGVEVSARTLATNELVASYRLGRFPRLGSQYALRIPMDTVNPRLPGRARPGDPIRIFIGTHLAAETVVGLEGVAVRLDIDPQNMGTGPSIRIDPVAEFEGNSGTTAFDFPIFVQSTGNDWTSPATIEWRTEDESASGGNECGPGIDYISVNNGILTIPVQAVGPDTQVGTITVLVCGDDVIEPDETFVVRATCIGCVLVEETAVGTIIDDDDVPELRFLDIYVNKPQGSTSTALFAATLSRSSEYDASFSYQTVDGSALAGVHYQAASGSITFAAGEVSKPVAVTLLPHPEIEPEREFRLQLGNPLGLSLQREQVLAFIIDPRFEPVLTPDDSTIGGDGGVPGLINPSAIVIAADGGSAYVVSETGDAVLHFARDDASGDLTLDTTYTAASTTMDGALLDAPRDLLLSADGAHLYVAARADNAINVLARDPLDGSLSLVQTRAQGQNVNGTIITGLAGAMALALCPDGRHLYAVGADIAGGGVAAFERDALDGRLTFLHAIVTGGLPFFERPSSVAVTEDGRHVMVAARNSNALHVFARNDQEADANFGRLTAAAVYRDGQAGVQGLVGAFGIDVSRDDRHVYVAAEGSNGVVWFERNPATGVLTWRERWNKGAGVPGLGGPKAIRVSPDQRYVFVPGFADNSLSLFQRVGGGGLELRQTLFDSQAGLEDMTGPMALDTTSDNRFVYVVANIGNAIIRLRIKLEDPIFADGFEDPVE